MKFTSEHFQRPGSSNMVSSLTAHVGTASSIHPSGISIRCPSDQISILPQSRSFILTLQQHTGPYQNSTCNQRQQQNGKIEQRMNEKKPSRVCCACLGSQDMEGRSGSIGSLRSSSATLVPGQPGPNKAPS